MGTLTKNMARLLVLCLAWTTCACAANHYQPAPTIPTDDPEFTPPEKIVMPGLKSDPPQPLKLMPGDIVTLTTVSAETQIYPGLIVDATGNLHVPLAGDVQVGRETLGVAEKAIEKKLRRYDRFVRANLIISEPLGHSAAVLGAVVVRGRFPVPPGTRLADLIALAGGPLTSNPQAQEQFVIADLEGARLIREGNPLPVSIPLAIQGDLHHNIRVVAGDQLYVPFGANRMIMVIGNVSSPQPLAYREGMRLSEAISRAGGIAPQRGDRNDIRIVRGPLTEPQVYVASVKDLVNGNATDVELAPGDIIYVTEHWFAKTGDLLNAIAPLISVLNAAAVIAITDALLNRD